MQQDSGIVQHAARDRRLTYATIDSEEEFVSAVEELTVEEHPPKTSSKEGLGGAAS